MLAKKAKLSNQSSSKQSKRKKPLSEESEELPSKKKRKISTTTKTKGKENKKKIKKDGNTKKAKKQKNKNQQEKKATPLKDDEITFSIQNKQTEEGWMLPLVNENVESNLDKDLSNRLHGANFRLLNEQLYSNTGKSSYQYFSKNPSLFELYHEGYRSQIQKWPEKPISHAIQWLKSNFRRNSVIADFGCGDAEVAETLESTYKVHSFDLVAVNRHVTACDMSRVPLPSNSVDGVVFCLALMGKNFNDFLKEAHRVLKVGGYIWLAEVTSRVVDYRALTKTFDAMGCKQIRFKKGKYFFEAVFEKSDKPPRFFLMRKEGSVLKPSLYKKR
eukprot:gb/GECH01000285.1/.p1 GENE.gb/GECH01000285.1/~~gb/GECH01000285.1/.p1  ORF type:complete len:330 (+),score=80.87 gb/GECH01000285.1/:1-990(+)